MNVIILRSDSNLREAEDTEELIKSRKSEDREYSGQKKNKIKG